MEQEKITKQQDNNLWKITLAIICIAIIAYGFIYSKNTTTDIAFLIGYNLPATLFIWGIFHISVAKKFSSNVSGFSFLLIFISLMVSSLTGASQQKLDAKVALSEIQDQINTVVDSLTDSQGNPKRTEKPINTVPKARGEFGEIERFMKEYLNQLLSQRNDYLLELEAIGWNSILDVNRIKSDKAFTESDVMIQRAKEIVNKYREKFNILLNNTRESIHSLDLSKSSKRSMLSGFDQGMEKSKRNREAIWSLEEGLVKEVEKIINLLSTRKSAWIVEGEQIMFYNDNDLDRFNSYFASIQNLVSQQEEMQRQSVQSVNTQLDRMTKIK